MLTDDEKRIQEIEDRAIHDGGKVTLTERDFKVLLASRLAWKFTAKSFAATDAQ